ncbi:glycosyltransferase [Microbacterium lacus]|uniref:Glycosyl transferase family 1 domain-containing protein n=1 Tax=Microbacterium lacus TaxID=415217 RepID=A0ABN2G2L9_9MICO
MTAPLRVAHLDHTSAGGGAEYALARMLAAGVPWRPLLLLPRGQRGGAFTAIDGRVGVRTNGVAQPAGVSGGSAATVGAAALRLAIQALSTRLHRGWRTADIVDANTARAAAYGALAALLSRRPFVVHLRDLVDAESLGTFGFAMMSRIALPRADGVIANSRATLLSAAPFVRSRALTAVIPSASGLSGRPSTSPPVRSDGPLRVGMLARIDPWKGQSLLLEAFAVAFADGDEVLEFAGGAPFGHESHVAELSARARALGIADRVVFSGHVEDVPAALARWDIAVQASLRPEPLGQNVLQYLSAGVACIVADEGGPAEWVEDGRNGTRFAPRDSAALAAALRALAADPARRARFGAAGPRTPGLLTDAEVVAAHADFYREVARRPQSHTRA